MDVVERPPLEEYFTRFNLHFLEDAFHDPSYARFYVPWAHVILPLLIDCHESGLAIVDGHELMHIARRHSAPGLHRLDNAILIVHYDTMASTVTFLLIALEETEVVRTFILAHVHSMDISRARGPPATPYQVLHGEVSAIWALWNGENSFLPPHYRICMVPDYQLHMDLRRCIRG